MIRDRSRQSTISIAITCAFLFCVLSASLRITASEAANAASAKPPTVERLDNTLTLDNLVRGWLRIPTLEHSNVGLEIMEVPSGRVLYSFNGNRRYTPASTVKAITCACAYDTLGGAYTYKTTVIADGTFSGTTLNGNLVIVPSQNPTFGRGQLAGLIKDAIQATSRLTGSGTISDITGQIKIAPTGAGDMGFHQAWLVEDWGRHWMPVASNLVLDRNLGSPGELGDSYRVVDAANTHGSLFDTLLNSPDGPTWVNVDRSNHTALTYRPKHPQAPKQPSFAMSNPDEYNLALAELMVKRNGVRIGNQEIPPSANINQLAAHESKPLAEIIRTCLHESDNLYAQQLLRTIGATTLKTETAPAGKSTERNSSMSLEARGLIAMSKWLSKIGVNGQEVILFDGCGLCRKNAVSPHALDTVLKHMAGEKADGPYLGLLKQNDESSAGKGTYQFKTGTMESVRCIAGILKTAGNQKLAVTIMVNGHTPTIRNLRIAESALINQLRSIKQIGQAVPKDPVGSASDPNIVETTHEPIVVDHAAAKRTPKPVLKRPRATRKQR
ncbi:D-alanyl-D-alanine carboxypeptidase/D-alanyl-D-alanine-endopeptidase [Candidatus Obscuribacterales bacterium]|nr:D-alanyl-D-alanine carboxypeptidase/D-alanyl-D-alanine-endopeptidase [Candidatus Obscuribacterales bacterium]